jgi:hypothetical protein
MQVEFESQDAQGAAMRDLAVQRVQYVMRRLAQWVPRARVQLADLNGPRGGLDKQCRVEFKTDRAGAVVITAVARTWRSALDRALLRASQAVLRLKRRARRVRANRPPVLEV